MEIEFNNKTVLVTGASRGIGKATALYFAQSGAKVIVHYNNNEQAANETLNLLPGKGHFILKADISNPEQCRELAKSAIHLAGKIDVLINNAGIYEEISIRDVDFDSWQENWNKTIATNLTGTANLSFFISNHMADKGGGKIINVSSRGAFRGEPDAIAYGASKAGMNALGQSMAKALAEYNVFVFTVAPGFVETEMAKNSLNGEKGNEIKMQSPLKRVAKPEEVARAIILLASDGTDFMTGSILDINGASYLRT